MSNQYLVIHMTDSTGIPLPRSEDQRILGEWAEEGHAAGRLGEGAPVAGPEEAKSVAVRDGKVLVTDGPFPEFKEWFAGYDLITADSIGEAAAYMAKHPTALLGRVYILPVVKLPWEE
ncbi:YciI family protein [Microbacterium sp. SD291]|uniref:YciI family protein n=1 Tax=Microbacterium sp. SD291 TaxID=2782007 RepID=UPI001A959F6B|nr:YciI family protein [Microbacterium sp. SD291]MBO0980686.1 transcription initiation protein [Microbacterium sp. SD291]